MGIDAQCTAKICFVDDTCDEAQYLFKQIVANNFIFGTGLKAISFKRSWIDAKISMKDNHHYNIIEMEIDDSDFWFERWGLKTIKDPITGNDVIDESNEDWCACCKEFCKHFGCILDIDTPSDRLHCERFVISPAGEVWLEEENDGVILPVGDIEWSNADYGKKTLRDLLILHYMPEDYNIKHDLGVL